MYIGGKHLGENKNFLCFTSMARGRNWWGKSSPRIPRSCLYIAGHGGQGAAQQIFVIKIQDSPPIFATLLDSSTVPGEYCTRKLVCQLLAVGKNDRPLLIRFQQDPAHRTSIEEDVFIFDHSWGVVNRGYAAVAVSSEHYILFLCSVFRIHLLGDIFDQNIRKVIEIACDGEEQAAN